jgi:hypothetical protein
MRRCTFTAQHADGTPMNQLMEVPGRAAERFESSRFFGIFGVSYGSRTRVAAVKEKQPIVIQRNLAAWIALYRTSRTHGNAYWTLNGRAFSAGDYLGLFLSHVPL